MEENTDVDGSLRATITNLTSTIERTYSYKAIFLRGIVNGVGTFVGATIIAAIVITILTQTLGLFGIAEYFESFLPKN